MTPRGTAVLLRKTSPSSPVSTTFGTLEWVTTSSSSFRSRSAGTRAYEVAKHLAERDLFGVKASPSGSDGLNFGSLSFTWNASSSSLSNHIRTGMPIETVRGDVGHVTS